MSELGQRLMRSIEAAGPVPVSDWMAACLEHYYATRDPLGRGGDFITAPEISQMFGELIGVWCAELWQRTGSPKIHLVEIGPGRGTLMADLWRATAKVAGFHAAADVHFVETSPALRTAQAERVPHAIWHDSLESVPDDLPMILIANEFFDALPIKQFIRTPLGWRERMVGVDGGELVFVASERPGDLLVPAAVRDAPEGSVWEVSPASAAVAAEIGERLHARGGAALIIDYGYSGPALGDTLQAVRAHGFADLLADAGEADLTAHVDFTAIGMASGVELHGPVDQSQLLLMLGLRERTEALARNATPEQAALLRSGSERLIAPDAMGSLFKALALTGTRWPIPTVFR